MIRVKHMNMYSEEEDRPNTIFFTGFGHGRGANRHIEDRLIEIIGPFDPTGYRVFEAIASCGDDPEDEIKGPHKDHDDYTWYRVLCKVSGQFAPEVGYQTYEQIWAVIPE